MVLDDKTRSKAEDVIEMAKKIEVETETKKVEKPKEPEGPAAVAAKPEQIALEKSQEAKKADVIHLKNQQKLIA